MLENALKASKFSFSVVNGSFSEKCSLGAPGKAGFDWVKHTRIEIKANQGRVVKVFKPGASVSKVQPYIGMKIHIIYYIVP